jgi:hypothetical protein
VLSEQAVLAVALAYKLMFTCASCLRRCAYVLDCPHWQGTLQHACSALLGFARLLSRFLCVLLSACLLISGVRLFVAFDPLIICFCVNLTSGKQITSHANAVKPAFIF